MNKLTKQLLSLGLSVVTVAGMVSPVLAEGVDETQGTGDSPVVEKEADDEIVNVVYSTFSVPSTLCL